ncbi:MAG TPA: hypothetical protein VFX15_09940 [Actinomycetes bacterium]|nr:hypothetical protein [Actinomycetes bacterium]
MPPLTAAAGRHDVLLRKAASQGAVISRDQARSFGVSDDEIAAHISADRWQAVHPGVYYLSNGSPRRETVVWAALLWAGDGSALGFESAGERVGLVDPQPVDSDVVVLVPWERQVKRRPGVVIRRRRGLIRQVHLGAPPSTRVEHTVLDLASEASTVRDAVGWVTRSYQRRLTTPDRLMRALEQRVRIRRRPLLKALAATVSPHADSALEAEYDRVASRHGLPNAVAQRRETLPAHRGSEGPGRRRLRRDRDYKEFNTVVELDGHLGHDDAWDVFRDMDRDNDTQEMGRATLRYGYADVFGRPCGVARQVAVVLQNNGWSGRLRPCGPSCTALG